ncbi:phosphatidylserine synthase [Agrobacterium fabrum]|jgi:CDP-diacylglycerol--serine O-phosphatidyltransferase|nr:phosphatidylserine synthase [Agrobacterium fabrum]KJX88896.1 phosphatidylserine synthase [Agrobacterium tumefaciens]AYM61866.1 phosphatidylserine synthase [Agrobacterium fabrum]MDH6294509.1 CDP-diacylglycerol--serine O-phosphatidyltransferase [Agrobacterium fabrum]WJK74519.1 phosphatidylserine synthase [Agrobacterium fabrum]
MRMETPISEPQQNGKQEGRSDSGRGPRLREIPFRLLVPNLITVLAICAGLSGVRLAIEGRFELAVGMVLLAAFLDGVDGRVARMMKATSKFGEQMDSLADIVNFGVAPALVVYIYLLDQARSIGWIGALIYVIAAGLRLARFNVMIERPVKAPWQSEFFVGVPAPMGAMLVLLPVYLGFLGVEPDKPFAYVAAAYTVLIGYLLISRLPVWSGKSSTRIRRDLVLPMILVVVLYVAMLMSFTWEVLVLTVAAYLVFIPISARLWHRRYGTLTIEEDAHDDANGGNGLDRGI